LTSIFYNHAGLLVRQAPAALYTWRFLPGVQYLYTPFAALGFAAGSLLPWAVLRWLMAAVSFAAVLLTAWVTFGQLGWRRRYRGAAVLGVGAVGMWTVPVLVSLQQGQIELVLMALIAWDLCQPDNRRWKGAGVGLAAGIKLVPLIFILYLILAGKLRHAAVAAALAAVFADWPAQVTGPRAFLPYGLMGFDAGPHSLGEIFRLHGIQLVSWNLFVLAGLAMFAFLLAWAAIAWRRGTGLVSP
jgi:hypothetical protein